jgi:RNA polymerase sigma-70 factor, ECF subfamily
MINRVRFTNLATLDFVGVRQPRVQWDWARLRRLALVEAQRFGCTAADAEEVAQEALIRAWRHQSRCYGQAAQNAWVRQIARREALRAYAKQRTLSEREASFDAETSEDDPGYARVISALAVSQLLRRLQPAQRQLIALRYGEDLTQTGVAKQLGIPEGTVKVQLHRARLRLRDALEESL